MKSLSETEKAAENVQLGLLHTKTPAQRSRLVFSLTHTAIFHAKMNGRQWAGKLAISDLFERALAEA